MKILVVRFSSIGDIVLTTPVLRCIKSQIQDVELHFATKAQYKSLVSYNPYIDQLHLLESDFSAFVKTIKKERFDFVVDLHHNLRTCRMKAMLQTKSKSFHKLNFQKWLTVRTKNKKYMPNLHIVDRYMETVKSLGVTYDNKGLDFFEGNETLPIELQEISAQPYHAVAIGGSYFTKRMPVEKLAQLLFKSTYPLILLGGKEDSAQGELLTTLLQNKKVYNLCGKLTLIQSAIMVKHCFKLITHDTGLMHIGAAFDKPTISIWGNTIPEFGMYPFFANDSESAKHSVILEVKNLSCRPCSKLGFDHCPRGHFKCMRDIDFSHVEL
ncbi:MAG: glycosyltransferase family 9 protein [Bacteroidia bacterium]|nr:glycosyltransferase family 9 protein [Bacteroidia bacterium]